jgi:hypothetical protein
MAQPQEIELLACGYAARCAAKECRRRATTILRRLDDQGRLEHHTEACDDHAAELCFGMKVVDRKRRSE